MDKRGIDITGNYASLSSHFNRLFLNTFLLPKLLFCAPCSQITAKDFVSNESTLTAQFCNLPYKADLA